MIDSSTNYLNCEIGNQIFAKKPGLNLKCFPYVIHPPVKTFKGRDAQLKVLQTELTEKQIVVVSGRGGVGKTELVKKYASENKPVYEKFMFWVNAKSEDTISKTFKALFKTLYEYDKDINHLDLVCIISNVYSFFEKPTLIVFDNATDQTSIFNYLPNNTEHNKHIYTIITTQNKSWKGIKIIPLIGVSEDEALDIFRGVMGDKYNEQRDEDHWKSLAKQLGYLPLAIQIAAAYIYEESDEYNSEFTVAQYIENLNKNAEILVEHTEGKTNSLATTFDLTLKKINKEVKKKFCRRNKNISVMDLLNICAYLDPYFITMKRLLFFFKENDDNLRDFLRVIDRYSLIYSNGANIIIHDEIQHILRYRQEKNNENKYYFFKLLQSLIADEDMFYHCRYAMQYAEKHPDIAVEFYEKTRSSKYLIILTQFGCHNVLKKIFDNLYQFYCCCGTPHSKIKKHVLLYEAVLSRDVKTVELLLEYSKKVNVKNKHGWTPLRTAVECKCFEIQALLVEHGASEETTDNGVTQLHECLRDGHLRLAYFLIDTPLVVNIPDDDGNTPLHYTAENPRLFENNDFVQIVGILIDRMENPNAVNNFKNTALHLAAIYGNLELASLLIEKKVDYCLRNKKGNTPLVEAAINNRRQLVMYLCENDMNNANILKNKKGNIALHYAVKLGFEEIATYLAENVTGSTVVKGKCGNTPLHLAVIFKKNAILLKLLGATTTSINIANEDGHTPLKLAERSNNTEAITCLREYKEKFDNSLIRLEVISGNYM